jgi:hypothetical protein
MNDGDDDKEVEYVCEIEPETDTEFERDAD